MTVIETTLFPESEEYKSNREYMLSYVDQVRDVERKQLEKEESYRPKAEKKGKLLPRERLNLLLDPGTPFLELSAIAGYQMFGDEDGSTCGGNIICGIGYVSARRCLVIVWNYAIKGGTINAATTRKMLRLQEIAFKTGLPVISLSESGGGNLGETGGQADPWGAVNFLDGGRCYANQAAMSAKGIVQINVAHGNATAGGAYHVGLSDYIVLVKGQSQIFLAGPPLLKAATGEEADAEELGGAEMHANISGTGEYLAENDADGIRIAREIMQTLPKEERVNAEKVVPPRYSVEELLGVVPPDPKVPYDVREIIARIADGSEFFEFSREIDRQTICGHITIEGKKCGVIGNNGPITPKGALKTAHFLQLLDQASLPVVFLQNTTGFLVGVDVEQSGQVKHGSKLMQAVMNFRGPRLTIVVGNSYGAGNYAMASRALDPDFVFSWPSARTAVMGGTQAAKVLEIVAEGQLAKMGQEMDDNVRKMIEERSVKIEKAFETFSESMYCSARIMDDGIIDPRDTRKVLSFLLETCLETKNRKLRETTFGVPRF